MRDRESPVLRCRRFSRCIEQVIPNHHLTPEICRVREHPFLPRGTGLGLSLLKRFTHFLRKRTRTLIHSCIRHAVSPPGVAPQVSASNLLMQSIMSGCPFGHAGFSLSSQSRGYVPRSNGTGLAASTSQSLAARRPDSDVGSDDRISSITSSRLAKSTRFSVMAMVGERLRTAASVEEARRSKGVKPGDGGGWRWLEVASEYGQGRWDGQRRDGVTEWQVRRMKGTLHLQGGGHGGGHGGGSLTVPPARGQ